MTDKLICPFCGEKLQQTFSFNPKQFWCSNYYNHKHPINLQGTKELWLALIDTKKKLDIAVDALKEQQRWLGIIRISMVSHLNNENETVFQPYDADPTVLNIGKAKVLLNNALEQIKEQQ